MNSYDYIIVGAGPAGLTLSLLLSNYKKKIALIENKPYIGGCHGVKRVNGLFSEHGPRIYIDNYFSFKKILKNIGTSFDELFTKYNFGSSNVFNEVNANLSIKEMFTLFSCFICLNNSYKKISLEEFMNNNNFSKRAKSFLERVGKLTDGGDAKKYTLYNFLQIINQNLLYSIYQPKYPNDQKLFKIWKDKLIDNGVDIFLDSHITNIEKYDKNITKIYINNNIELTASNYILAMPPYSIYSLIKQHDILTNSFGNNFDKWVDETNYITYIPVIFHWNTQLKIKKIWGMPKTEWGVGHIVLSDYIKFDDLRSQTVISTLITSFEKSKYLNVTPNELSDKNIIIKEVFRQLKTIISDLPEPSYSIMSENYYDIELNKWMPINSAFMTTKYGYINYKSQIYNNLYNCGVQNGNSLYSFTSLESSVQNSIELVHKLLPESKNDFTQKNILTVRFILLVIFIIFAYIVIYYLF